MFRLTVQYDVPSDPATFDTQYFSQHVPLCASIPGLQATTFSKPRVVGPGTAPYLVAELDFEDVDSFKAAMASPEMGAVAADADTLPAGRVMFTGQLSDG
ncbi:MULTISPECIES: EthD family reductase [unclassified Nocardioides]|uniref:EthD family reductase n=1 Tax=unclassified Nocardioides TaxID=2615069 RepID=UPI0006F9091C|nr:MULTISPECIES: EthD family reductase [unclassified Nocardioides]KRA30015.1 hypothetical protein ASD81_20210 [Nocardioides sp. Root614]KRA86935.1 hypothetical protein ASD84_22425 [Nocardioides sp. Root682]